MGQRRNGTVYHSGGIHDHPYFMVHSSGLGIAADGCNYTDVIAKPCEMMHERKIEKPIGRKAQTRGRGGGEIGYWGFGVSADHIKTRFRVLALFIPFSSKLK